MHREVKIKHDLMTRKCLQLYLGLAIFVVLDQLTGDSCAILSITLFLWPLLHFSHNSLQSI